MMCARRRGDGDRVEVFARDQLERIRMDARDVRGLRDVGNLVAMTTAKRCDVPPLRAERRDVDLGTEPDADDADSWHARLHGFMTESRGRSPNDTIMNLDPATSSSSRPRCPTHCECR